MSNHKRSVGPFKVAPIGLGCMNLDHAYAPSVSEADGTAVLRAAIEAGYNFFDTATLYGGGLNESRLGRILKPYRHHITLASKCGMAIIDVDGKKQRVIDGRPETLKRECENSLRRLQTDVIDLYYLHRWDKTVPIDDSVGALSDLVKQGLIRSIGLSEISAATLRKAHAVHPIAAVQTEYSLWTRNPEIAVLQACKELGVAFVAFSPVGRGSLCGPLNVEQLKSTDIRFHMPRFKPEAWQANSPLLSSFIQLAHEANMTPAQMALAWLLKKDPHIVPIPGSTQVQHVIENFQAVDMILDLELQRTLEALFAPGCITGERYDTQSSLEVDTETF